MIMHDNCYSTICICILNIILASMVHCSIMPFNNSETNQRQRDIQSSLINNVSNEESSAEKLETEYDDDFIDYYQSTRNFNGNSEEFIESWSRELSGILNENDTTVDKFPMENQNDEDDIVEETIDQTDSNDEKNNIVFENLSENEKELLLQLRKSLKLGSASFQHSINSMIPPQFMTDLYQAVTDSESGITIRNYPHGASEVWSVLETNPYVPGLFQFDLSGINYEELMDAELHVYRIGIDASASINHQPYYLLRVYQVMPTEKYSLSLNPDIHQLLNVHYVSAFGTGWQVFKVKRAVESWKNGTSPNLGLLVTATTILNEPIDVRFSRKHDYGDKYQPTLILFTTNNKNIPDYNKSINQNAVQPQFKTVTLQKSSTEICSINSLYIDFTKIGWSQFVVSPMGFQAYQCSGKCDWPMTAGYNSTNHAIVRAVLSHIGYNTTAACCVPTELDSITVLYIDDNNNFVLRTLEHMVVKKCECH